MTDRPYLRAPFLAALEETRLEQQLAASLLASLDRCGACGGEVGQPARAVPLGQWDDQGREFWDRCPSDVHSEIDPTWGSTHPAFLGLTDYPTE